MSKSFKNKVQTRKKYEQKNNTPCHQLTIFLTIPKTQIVFKLFYLFEKVLFSLHVLQLGKILVANKPLKG
jgi:hypothetical protein